MTIGFKHCCQHVLLKRKGLGVDKFSHNPMQLDTNRTFRSEDLHIRLQFAPFICTIHIAYSSTGLSKEQGSIH